MKRINRIQSDKIKLFFIIMIGAFCVPFSFSQNKKIDSLLILLKKEKIDTNKVKQLYKLCAEYQSVGLYDTAMRYANMELQLAQQLNRKRDAANSYNSIGIIYRNQGNYSKAIDNYFKELKIGEEIKDKNQIATALGNIGIIYGSQNDYTKALDYSLKALKLDEELGHKNAVARHLGNIGGIYSEQKNYINALDCYFKALKMAKELGDRKGIARHLGNIGEVYRIQKDYTKALDYYFKSLKIAEEIGNKNSIVINLGAIGSIYTTTKKYAEAEKYLQRSLSISESMGALNLQMDIQTYLSELYEKTSKPVKALAHYKKAIAEKDTLFNQEKDKQITRKEMSYEFEKKEATAKAENEKHQAVADEKNRKQKIIIWSVAFGLFLMVAFAGFIFRSLRITRKQKRIIEIKNTETEIQKKIIEEKNKEITDSINYASRIQQAMLTSEEYISKYLPADYFILYQPKDIVSGDFYWAFEKVISSGNEENIESKFFYLATSDCTGHGVPGAFMSLLNISFLNENVIERNIIEPNKILNEQRKEIIKALNPKGTENSKDGMDCVLCKFDFNSMTLTFAAANNPLWLVRNGKLIEYFADKMPVGKYNETDKEFSRQTIQLQKDDIVYTFTDGYTDQFGGPNGKKFKHKQFEELLLSNYHLPMKEQHNILERTINSWKGKLEQVDDILVVGVKV